MVSKRAVKTVFESQDLVKPLPNDQERFRHFIETSSDGYWEWDARFRFTLIAGGAFAFSSKHAKALLGTRLWDHEAVPMGDSGRWDACKTALKARQQFDDFVIKRATALGDVQYLSVNGRPIFDKADRFKGYRGSVRDVTKRVQMQMRLAVEHAVTLLLESSGFISEAAPRIIRAICEAFDWTCGARWEFDETTQALHCAETWGTAASGVEEFLSVTRQLAPTKRRGGLNRRVWADGKPLWILDVTRKAGFRRAAAARNAGLHSAFAFPIKSGAKTIGVFEFFSRALRHADANLLDCATYVGSQIGQFIQRKRAEDEQLRFRAAIDVSADLVFLVDPSRMKYVDANETACRSLGYSREELLTMGPDDVFTNSNESPALQYERLIAGDQSAATTQGWYRRRDGTRFAVETMRRALPFGNGHTIVSVARDVGERQHAEQLLKLEHSVTLALSESQGVSAALNAAMRSVCETQGWEFGRYLAVDEQAGVLRFSAAWGVTSPAIEHYIESSRDMTYAPGVGIVGRVWQSGQPLWIADISADARVARSVLARETGMRGAFSFAVRSQDKTIGVLIFHSREIREPDERLLAAARVIGSQISQFIQRKQAETAQRESEARFRGLTQLSSDMYWEQDSAYRFTSIAGIGAQLLEGRNTPLVGKRRWDTDYVNMSADQWSAHIAVLEARLPFHDLELCRLDDSGEKVWTSVSGEPVFDAAGIFTGYRGVGKVITVQKREEQVQLLEHSVVHLIANARTATEAMTSLIRAICETENWECGRYFRVDESAGVLRFAESWGVSDPGIQKFIERSRGLVYESGVGLAGRVWASGQPLWVADVAHDARAMRAGFSQDIDIRGAFVFPVLTEDKTIGVLAFNSRRLRALDSRLMQAIEVIGSQIGQYLRRKETEEEQLRFRAALDASADMVMLIDPAAMRFVDVNEAVRALLGYTKEELLQMGPQDVLPFSREALVEAYAGLISEKSDARDLHNQYRSKDGVLIPFESALRVLRAGKSLIIAVISRDIRERMRADQLLKLEHTVTLSLSQAQDAAGAIQAAIRTVCEAEGWECGRYFRPEGDSDVLHLGEAWGLQTPAIERYIEGSRNLTYAPGVGLVGMAWQSGQPLWIADLYSDARVSQRPLAHASGIHGSFVFPVASGGRAIGVLVFNSRDVREPEERLLQSIHVIGTQIGQFVQRKQAEEALRASEERFRSLTLLSSDEYWEQDAEYRYTSIAGTGSQSILSQQGQLMGKRRWEHDYVNMTADDWAAHVALLEARRHFQDLELCRIDASGNKVWISVSGEPVFDSFGAFKGYRGVGKKITERKLGEERIEHLARHDALTALPNRLMFSEMLNITLHNSRRYNRNFCVMFIDLDRFKIINDTLGHEAGDKLLQEIAVRLGNTVRTGDVVARLGGDEFVILLNEQSEPKQVEAVARKILSAVAHPMFIDGQECRVTASVGICMFPSGALDEQSLMKSADIAMYRAKEEGKNTFKIYSEELNVHSFERMALETSMRHALDRDEFFLHYQPKLDLNTGRITGVEALLRWQHPELGFVSPVQFIPLAEETGFIVPLGKWVLNTACQQNAAWHGAGLPDLLMAVNLSSRQFSDEDLLKDIESALANSGMKPQLLELELTESMMMQSADRAGVVLDGIKQLGVRLAIDDFGVGYSSLTHLKHFPIDTLKIDRSFIRDIPQSSEDMALTQAIIAMGKSLDLTVVAEGVETLEQENFLRKSGCNESQGFYFSKPLSAERFAAFLEQHLQAVQNNGVVH